MLPLTVTQADISCDSHKPSNACTAYAGNILCWVSILILEPGLLEGRQPGRGVIFAADTLAATDRRETLGAKVMAYPEPHHLHRVQVFEMLVNPSQLLPYVENPRKKNHQREKEEEAVFKLGNQYPHLLSPDFLSFTQACSAFPGSVMSGFFY